MKSLAEIEPETTITVKVVEGGTEIKKKEGSLLLNPHLLGFVSKLEILRSFSVFTTDLLLAEQIDEAAKNEQEKVAIKSLGERAQIQVMVKNSILEENKLTVAAINDWDFIRLSLSTIR